jgi:hypothetical protein
MPSVPKPEPRAQQQRFAHRRDPIYATWVRTQRCLVYSASRCIILGLCEGPVEADHVRTRGAGGDDRGNLIPLCRGHHAQRHRMGVQSFAHALDGSLADWARTYWAAYQAGGSPEFPT